MKCSDQGLEFIMRWEGCELAAYPDPATGGEPWTIGVGHTGHVKEGDTITHEQALELLRKDIETAEKCLNNSAHVDITQNQFDALCSLVFNIGCGNFRRSTLRARLNEDVDDDIVAKQFLVWNRAAGKVMAGLTNRREAEKEVFLT